MPATLDDILTELRAIRAVLETRPTPQPTAAPAQSNQPSGVQAEIPQPAQVVADPGSVTVHFGKNQGKRLDELSERSAEWYGQESPAKLDSSGKPYPPRPQEIALKNAARTLYHMRKGSLVGAQPPMKLESPTNAAAEESDTIPF